MNEIVVPRLGWTMDQGVFLGWLKGEGDAVKAGEPLFALEGDKAAQEVEAIESGILRIATGGPKQGDTVAVGAVLGHIEQLGASSPPVVTPNKEEADRVGQAFSLPETGTGRLKACPTRQISPADRMKSTPRARRAAREHGVDLAQVNGTGRAGRIRERDVLALSPAAPSAPLLTPVRQTIAQRMVHSVQSTAPVTLTTLADATNLVSLRNQFKAVAGSVVPSFTDFFLKLTALALQKHPELNARWENDRIVTLAEINIGLAVDAEAGLVVPVVRNVPTLTLRQLATQTRTLIEAARSRQLKPADLHGGTFTVTNLGAYGIDAFTPIINWPECAILGIGAIRKQPVVVEDQVVAREAVTLSLTFDHRIVDGAPAARFVKTLRTGVENPSAWLVE